MRTRTLLLLAVVVTVVPVWLSGVAVGGDRPAPVRAVRSPYSRGSSQAGALAVLRAWDRRRADAWAAGDPAALARLYVPGSRTGARDAQELRRWVRRGLRVVGLHQQVASLVLAGSGPGRIVLVVTDRTVDGVAVAAGRRTAIPTSDWAAHRIVLVRSGHRWRVAEARPGGSQPAR